MLCGNFHENPRKKFSIHFSKHFWLIEAKTKMKIEKLGKTISIFEFSLSKFGYVSIFMKIVGKIFWPIFKTFLANRGKNKNKNKKIWKNEFEYWILHIKIRLDVTFRKNLKKKFFFEIFTWEGPYSIETHG